VSTIEAGAGSVEKVPAATAVFGAGRLTNAPRLSLLGETGEATRTYLLDRGEAVIGRGDADMRFEDDPFMSPLHARLETRNGQIFLRDLGSRNGTWLFIDQPSKLTDCDLILIGSQLIRFRRLGYPGPHPPEADSTRRMGSAVPTVDVAILEQIRADGSVRDTFHLSPGRPIIIGRESGDWIFPYDATMSGRHAEIRTEDSEFFVHDANSRNGVAMSVRGERELKKGQRLLVGDQILRLESV
jgi:pSer/pThr/pTyr-binding forkhead associated (FHA) protein